MPADEEQENECMYVYVSKDYDTNQTRTSPRTGCEIIIRSAGGATDAPHDQILPISRAIELDDCSILIFAVGFRISLTKHAPLIAVHFRNPDLEDQSQTTTFV